ncbi:MAG: hypothetical protein ACJ8F7_03910, partial [Gemmataceae bacterium]
MNDAQILALRPAKNAVDPARPYAFLVEPERTRAGAVEDTAVLFLTNRECPFRCLMCDLWKNTTNKRVPDGAIARQIEYALSRLPPARHVKLYNAGNFFDAQAIPPADWPRTAELMRPFETVIVESHPKLVGPRCAEFRELLNDIPCSAVAGGARENTPPPPLPEAERGDHRGPWETPSEVRDFGDSTLLQRWSPLPALGRGGVLRPELQVAMGLETVHPDVLPRLNKRMT